MLEVGGGDREHFILVKSIALATLQHSKVKNPEPLHRTRSKHSKIDIEFRAAS